ncbi:MAG: PKD domain-containing protein [Thermoplasmata archaeon]
MNGAASANPSFYAYSNYSDLSGSNQTGTLGGTFGVANNGAASYDPALQEVILFGGGDLSCRWGGGCGSNDTWIYQNGVWTNWTGFYNFFGAPPKMIGFTFTYDPQWDGSILAGGVISPSPFSPLEANPYTWLFTGGFWYNISVTVGPGPTTVFGSAAYDPYYGDLFYVNGCADYVCNTTNVEGLTYYLFPQSSSYGWQNGTIYYGGPGGYSFGSELAYDPFDQELVFFGGGFMNYTSGTYHPTNETWVYGTEGVWINVSLSSFGYACFEGVFCLNTYPLASGFGSMTWDGQLNAIVLFGGIDQYGYVTDQMYVFSAGAWYPYWIYNINMDLPPPTAFAAMPTNSSEVAPVLIGGDCTFNESSMAAYVTVGLGYQCTSDSWVLEIPPEPFITVATPNPADVGTTLTVSMYNTPNSGSGPNLSYAFFYGFFALLAPVTYDAFLDFGLFNASATITTSIPAPGLWDVGVLEEDFWGESAFNFTDVLINENVTAAPAASAPTELDQAGAAEVNFTANPSFGEAPYTYAWSFGAGQGTSASQNPTYTYTTAATFTVSLTVTDSFGQTNTTTLSVLIYPTLTASGAANASSGADVNGAVSFTGTAGGGSGGDTFSWSFGDGGHGGTAATQDAAFTFTKAGTYAEWFNVTDSLGFKATSEITYTVSPQLTAAPTESTATPTTATSVTFNAGIVGGTPAYTYSWDFGDGSSPSTSAAPSHTYGTTGAYTVTVTIHDAYGEKVVKTLVLTVSKAPASSLVSDLTSGTGLYALIAVIVIIVAALVAMMMMRRRKGGTTTSAPPAPWSEGPPAGGTGTPGAPATPPASPPAGSSSPPPPSGGA